MPQFEGFYTRRAGLRRKYAYKVTYGMRGNALGWTAAVHFGDELKGHPAGEFAFTLPPPEEEQHQAAERLTRDAIEALSGMVE
ncbi:MAG TPA: hypothetical protein VH105_08160 [Burkholderiales bacterium]|jgi:hypothetical protein|nr:hypothetical protein [Burkholderiales bacterium]